MKRICLALMLCMVGIPTDAQETLIENRALLKEYLKQSRFDIDSTAQAVVLYEKGFTTVDWNVMAYKVERTIKIIGKQALGEATVIIPVGEKSSVRKIVGVTYGLENDAVTEQKIERSEIIKEKITDNVYVAKFNLPGVKEGSIIHYSYIIESPTSWFVPDWYFQGAYPKLYSEYEIVIPSFIIFTSIEHTSVPSKKVNKKSELKVCDACNFYAEIGNRETNSIWVRKNVPAYKEEPFMLSKDNYIERIKVHVTAVSQNGYTKSVLRNWDQLNEDIFYKDDKLYGQVFSGNKFLADKTDELVKDQKTDIDKAKAIFRYVRDNITCKNSNEYQASNIKEVFLNREGNVYGINLLLTAMLRRAGLDSEPVLLATKNKESLNPLFADPRNINYLISTIQSDSNCYFLDASEKYVPFGMLPTACYNGLARTVNVRARSLYLTPDSIKDRSVTIVNIIPSKKDSGKVEIKANYILGNISGYALRKTWHNDSALALNDIEKHLAKAYGLTIKGKSVQNLADPDLPLKITIEAETELSSDLFYIDPYLDKFIDKNPLPSGNRMFPVTLDYKRDATYILSFQLPNNYMLDDYPKSTAAKLEDDGLIEFRNVSQYDKKRNHLRIQSHLTTNTTSFSREVYEPLREFYDHVIDEQNKKIVIKKLN